MEAESGAFARARANCSVFSQSDIIRYKPITNMPLALSCTAAKDAEQTQRTQSDTLTTNPEQDFSIESDRLTRWLAIGANLGVLIGIFLLIIDSAHDRDTMRAQIRHELATGIADLLQTAAHSAATVSTTLGVADSRRPQYGPDCSSDGRLRVRC